MNDYIDPHAFDKITENPVVIDFSECKYPKELHLLLKEKFGLPGHYGENWDALWDCLSDLFDENDELEIHLYNTKKMRKHLPNSTDKMLEVFYDVREIAPNVIFKIMS